MGSTVSYSQLSGILWCGEKLRLTKAGAPEAPAVYNVAGHAYHQATADYDLLREQGKDPTVVDMESLWDLHWRAELAEASEKEPDLSKWTVAGRVTKEKPNKEDIHWWADSGRDMCLAYRDYVLFRKPRLMVVGDRPAIEIELNVELGGVPVKVVIDRVYMLPGNRPMIVDLKTGARKPVNKLQLWTYAEAWQQVFDVRPEWGGYFMARESKLDGPWPLKYNVKSLHRQYETLYQMRKRGLYLANPGSHCDSCGVRRFCSAQDGESSGDYEDFLPAF